MPPPLSIHEGLFWDRKGVLERSVGVCQRREIRLLRYSRLEAPMRLSFEVEGRARFDWDGESGRIGFESDSEEASLLSYWLLDHALPFFLVSMGRFSLLHGGCSVVDGRGIAWIGPSGAGKTTLGGYALEMGHPLVADDKLPILRRAGRWLALPSHPYHRIDRVSETLGRRVENFARGPVPFGLLCLLEPVAASEALQIRQLSGREAFLRLSAHRGCRIRWREEEEFRLFSRLIREVPVVACRVPRDRARLPALFCQMRRALAGIRIDPNAQGANR